MNGQRIYSMLDSTVKDQPLHVQKQIAEKYVDNLRLCLTGMVPSGIHGPVLPPHMLPDFVTSSFIFRNDVAIHYDLPDPEIQSDIENPKITRHAIIENSICDAIVDLGSDVTHVIFPQQPFEVRVGSVTIDCSRGPSSVTSDAVIRKIPVRRVTTVKCRPHIFFAALALDIRTSRQRSAMYTIYSATSTLIIPLDKMDDAYKDHTIVTPSIKHRLWLLSKYDSQPVNDVARSGLVRIGPFNIAANVPIRSQSRSLNDLVALTGTF